MSREGKKKIKSSLNKFLQNFMLRLLLLFFSTFFQTFQIFEKFKISQKKLFSSIELQASKYLSFNLSFLPSFFIFQILFYRSSPFPNKPTLSISNLISIN